MPILAWVLLGAFATVVIISMAVFCIDEIKRIHDNRGPEDDEL